MPRRKHLRKIVEPPRFSSYHPKGGQKQAKEPVLLLYEEYEAIKLADYDGLHHHEACRLMGISRPTFARIYESARQKIAKALVEVREIQAVYGNVSFNHNWYECMGCHARFTLQTPGNEEVCPICSSAEVEQILG